jgi:hypothetical protein
MVNQNNMLYVYIGEDDIIDWTMIIGKDVMIPEILNSAESLLYNELDTYKCATVFANVGDAVISIEFSVKPTDVESTLDKILEWSIENEEYEMCTRVEKLRKFEREKNEMSTN